MTRHALLFSMTIALVACGPRQPDEAAPPLPPEPARPQADVTPAAPRASRPAPAASDVEEFDAVGTEPFWAVQVRRDTLRLSRPDYAEVIVAAPRPITEVKTQVWKADGMTISITPGACSDGMSDRRYAYVAEVRVGREVLRGCAYRPGAAPTATPA